MRKRETHNEIDHKESSFVEQETMEDLIHASVGSEENKDGQEQQPKENNYKRNRKIGLCIGAVQLLAAAFLIFNIVRLDVLPLNYFIGVCVILVVTLVITAALLMPNKTLYFGWGFAVLMSLILIVGNVYIVRTYSVINAISVEEGDDNFSLDNIVVAVLKDDQAESMDDALLYNFGIMKSMDRENTNTAISEIETAANLTLTVTEFDDFKTMVNALKREEIQAIIYNTAYDATIEEFDEDFDEKIKILNSHEIRTSLNFSAADMNVTEEPFTVYISGIDVFGDISQTSRSDVNMLVTIDPVNKEILMTTTPRDYWVPLPDVSYGTNDKLTHAGIYGVQCSMDTLSQVFGIEIDYYVRVNFTTLRDLVDALGGVNVYSEYEFTTHYKNGGYDIKQGYNQMNGKVALAFSRERYNVPGGDEQRGRDQQAVLEALIKKAMSPSILTGYMAIMDSVEGSFETNMSMNQIASLVKMQLADGASWNMTSQSVTGEYGSEPCFSTGYGSYSIMYPSYESVYIARKAILEAGGTALPETSPLYRSFDQYSYLDEIQTESETDTETEIGMETGTESQLETQQIIR